MTGGRVVSFPVDGVRGLPPQARATGHSSQAGGPEIQIDGGREAPIMRSSRISGR